MNRIDIAPSKTNCSAAMKDVGAIGGKLLSLSMDSSLKFIRGVMKIVRPAMSNVKTPCLRAVCDIPETDCPPRCVCDINWDACRGEHRQHAIRVTNTSKEPIEFILRAKPFSALAGDANLIVLQPDKLILKPGESGVSMASITMPENVSPGGYDTEILVQGKYEQCVRVHLTINNADHCACEVAQGDIPVRIRAHHWYDHFQCVEPCFEAIHRDRPDHAEGTVAKVVTDTATKTTRD